MKNLLFIALFLLANPVFSQNHNQPKLRVNHGFFSTNYELGEKDLTEKEVKLHLEKNSPSAYYDFRKGIERGHISTVCSALTSAGLLVGLLAKKTNVQLAGYGSAVVFGIASLSYSLGSGSKKDSAISKYNRQFGY